VKAAFQIAALALCACASFSKERGHDEVATLVAERTGYSTGWQQGGPDADELARRVDARLDGGLTPDSAVEIALVNNPELQTTYEELGISQAELMQAGLLKNPSLGAHVAFPLGDSLSELQFALVQDVLDLLILPLRRSIAADQFAVDVRRVAGRALGVVADVKKAFASFEAASKTLEMTELLVDAAKGSALLAEKQLAAGNISELELVVRQAEYEQLRLDTARDRVELEARRQELNALLGLWGKRSEWKLGAELSEPSPGDVDLGGLEAAAMRQRPDLDAARRQAALFQKAVDLARTSRAVGSIEVGVDYHRDADGPRVMGPSLKIELPIFDQRQAVIARLEAQQRQSEHRLTAVAVEARNDVRAASTRLQVARLEIEHFHSRLLPLRARAVQLAQLHYNGMQLGLPGLLAVKREELEAQRAFIAALRDYWVARAELERAVGGRLGPEGPTPARKEPR
jgi:cobalt-zinc-cadmium efflux system outer membrane protein